MALAMSRDPGPESRPHAASNQCSQSQQSELGLVGNYRQLGSCANGHLDATYYLVLVMKLFTDGKQMVATLTWE